MLKRDLDHKLRDSAHYRRERLEADHERLAQRLLWAMQRQDGGAIDRLSSRLDALEDELDASITPGHTPGPIEGPRW